LRAIATSAFAFLPAAALAHEPSELAKQRMLEGSFTDVAWLGAEHMLTGYDHILFLLGVMFFLTRWQQIVAFITAFTLGHTVVLLIATPLGIKANPYVVDAIVALTVIYKAFENLDGFRRVFSTRAPALIAMVFLFGLIHGFGLSTRLQDMALVNDPNFYTKIIAFNVGVELGQLLALAAMGAVLALWRHTPGWKTFALSANIALIVCGGILFAVQLAAYSRADPAVPAASLGAADRFSPSSFTTSLA